VSVAAVAVHVVFLFVAYEVLLRGRAESTLRFLWGDVSAAVVGCVAIAAVAVPLATALNGAGAIVHVAVVGGASAAAYLVTLRVSFRADFDDVMALARRVLPIGRLLQVARRMPLLAGRAS
jgi:hypothetical protein